MSWAEGELARFLPGALVEWASSETRHASGSTSQRCPATLLVADISGFTRLTAKLSRDDSKAGAERIRHVLDTFMARLAAIIQAEGGVVVSFEGDALMAGWRHEPHSGSAALATWRGCWCAERLHAGVSGSDVLGEVLTLRSAVAVGEVEVLHLRLADGSRKVVLAGACVSEVSRCAALAESGEILVSGGAWSLVRDKVQGIPTEDGVTLRKVTERPALPPPTGPESAPCDVTDAGLYLPSVLRHRLGSSMGHWLGELRTVTTLFVRMIGAGALERLETVEAAVDLLGAKAARLQGDVLRVAACEGGLQALVVFGLPGHAHGDDPRRACLAALDLQAAGRSLGLSISTGIASGGVFCGAIGTATRAEYTVLGEAVNRASRLSALAAGRVLTDDATAAQARAGITFEGPWTIQVAGLRAPLATYVATARRSVGGSMRGEPLVGRSCELQRLEALVRGPHQASGSLTLIEGEPGIGKSKLLEVFVESCRARDAVVLEGAADDLERNTPYFALRRMLREALQLEDRRGSDAHDRVAERLPGHPDQIRFIPLLNDVLELDLDESGTADALSSAVRAENLRRLLTAILAEALGPGPSVLAVEDVHWLDPQSDALLVELCPVIRGLTMVVTARPERPRPLAIEAVSGLARWRLNALNQDDSAELVRTHVGDTAVAPRILEAICERTSGNPFFIGELCRVIRSRVDPGLGADAAVRPEQGTDEVALPLSAQAAVLSRIDLLPQAEHFLLKIASAIGASFTAEDLNEIELVQATGIDVGEALTNLLDAHLVRAAGLSRFVFSHAIVREVIYSGMLSEQRRAAHAAVAEAMERAGHPSDAETLPLILTQWQRAENRAKCVGYLDRVAELRLRMFDNEGAIALTTSFIEMARDPTLGIGAERLASAHFIHAAAELGLGRNAEAQAAYELGLGLLDMPVPAGGTRLRVAVLKQIAEHLALSGRRSRRRDSPATARRGRDRMGDEVLLKAAGAHEDLTRIYYFQGNKARLLYATLRATNLAERATRLSPVLVVNYASLGAICGVVPLRGRATHYLRLAERLAETVGSPAVDIRVAQMRGLYETSVGDWRAACAHFEAGLASSLQLGDRKRWLEMAIGLETIINPSLLNPAYKGEAAWRSLVEKVIHLGREVGDLHILGCGLTGALRGQVGQRACSGAHAHMNELETLMSTDPGALEPISRLEGAAILAEAARDRGDEHGYVRWLHEASRWADEVNPGIKSRTLMAFVALFRAAARGAAAADGVGALRQRLASQSTQGLSQFSRIYPIGGPRTALFCGDLEARRGRPGSARRQWQQALREALRLHMPADALAALSRLGRDEAPLRGSDRAAHEWLEGSLLRSREPWVEAARRSAELLTIDA